MEDILVPVSLFAALAVVCWIVIASIRSVIITRMHTSVQLRLLDRLPSADSLIAYSGTPSGREFLTTLLADRSTRNSPYRSILNGAQAAILLVVFGVTLLLLHQHQALPDQGVLVFGTISVALGIGFALAATTTFFLSHRFGLLTPPVAVNPPSLV